MDKHLALYNLTTHEVDYIESYPDDAKEDLIVKKSGYKNDKFAEWEEKVSTFLVWEQRKKALEKESLCRGSLNGAWMVYTGDVPFTWDAVTPQEVPNA